MLASSDGGSVVVVPVVAVKVGAAEVVLLAGKGERVVVVVALVASVGTVGCALSLLVAQAVAVSAAMARTDTPRWCLIKLARGSLMPSDDNAGRVGSQVRAGWGEKAISGSHSRGQPLEWLFNDGYYVAAAY